MVRVVGRRERRAGRSSGDGRSQSGGRGLGGSSTGDDPSDGAVRSHAALDGADAALYNEYDERAATASAAGDDVERGPSPLVSLFRIFTGVEFADFES